MTSFIDRENAIEAHYAFLELSAFQDRLHRYKELGLILAQRMEIGSGEAERFATELAARCATEANDEALCANLAVEFKRAGLSVSPNEIRRAVIGGAALEQPHLAPISFGRSWLEFVMTQLLALFGGSRSGDEPGETGVH